MEKGAEDSTAFKLVPAATDAKFVGDAIVTVPWTT